MITAGLDLLRTAVDVPDHAAIVAPEQAIVHLCADGSQIRSSYGQLGVAARRVCAGLDASRIRRGDRVAIQSREPEHFVVAFRA